jgi:hypothetical protein
VVGIVRNDAPNLVDDEFEPLIEQVALALDGDELADIELWIQIVDVLEDLRVDLARHILELEDQEGASSAGSPIFSSTQEEAGAGRASGELRDLGQSSHVKDPGVKSPASLL